MFFTLSQNGMHLEGFKRSKTTHMRKSNNLGRLNCFIVQLAIKNIKLYMKDLICVDFS